MDGRAIAGAAFADAGLRRLVTEIAGPRPGGVPVVRGAARSAAVRAVGTDTALATKP